MSVSLVPSFALNDAAHRWGAETFVTSGEEVLTYAGLADRAARVAALLRDVGVRPGDRVATMLDPCPDYLSVWFAVSSTGAIEVPVNTAYAGAFLEHVLVDSGATVLVADATRVERLREIAVPDLRCVVVVGSGPDFEKLPVVPLSAATNFDPSPPVTVGETDPGVIMYTSGTTGRSKGVLHTNRSFLTNSLTARSVAELDRDDVAYSFFPLFHITARSFVIGASLLAGSSVLLRPRFSRRNFWEDVRKGNVTWFPAMGAVVHLLLAADPDAGDRDHELRLVCAGAVTPEVRDSFIARFGTEMIDVYGMTETGTISSQRIGHVRPGTSGRPVPHVQIAIHDENDRPVPTGTQGEIVVRPEAPDVIFRQYWGRPQDTVDACKNLWFHTGDAGYLDSYGDLVFVDRIKDAIRRRGENISSFEVERVVVDHASVQECAAYPVPSEWSEDEVMVSVVLRPGVALKPKELWDWCESRLPDFAVPRFLRYADDLPKNASERVLKHELRALGVTSSTYDRAAPEDQRAH